MRTLTFNRILGSGAMGTVYHAELRVPQGFARQCAVKVMRAAGANAAPFRARIRDEARLLGMLQDETVLGVTELTQVEGRDCVIMEYVEGVDLHEVMSVRTVPPRALAELGAELAGTLHRAHTATHPSTGEALNVIHRDVKPANVMVTARGGVRLLDFGVARARFETRESQTQGLVLGTLNYFPPEIMQGAEPSQAVDIYGLGITMWECATGRDWGTPKVKLSAHSKRVELRLGELPEAYDPLVEPMRRMLAWDPEDRPQGAVAEELLHQCVAEGAGQGLRAWARKAVPPLLQRRSLQQETDDWIGKTLTLGTLAADLEVADPSPRGRGPEVLTYNDLAPPAAVQRKATPRPAEARPVVKATRRRVNPLLLLGIAAFLGISLGLACAVVLIGVIVVLRVI